MRTDSSMGHATQDAPGVALKPGHNSRTCEQCGGKFSPRAASGGKPQKFCSPQCRTAFHADAQLNVSQRSPTCSAQTRLPAVIPHAKKDEPADAGKDFDWQKADDDVVLRVQPETAVYLNPYGALVIRQHGWPDDDSIVVISAECIDHFIDELTDIVGIQSLGRYRPLRPPTRAAQERDPTQLEFDFTRTTPLQLTPAAARKEYAEYRRTVRDEPDRRSKTPQRRPPHGAR